MRHLLVDRNSPTLNAGGLSSVLPARHPHIVQAPILYSHPHTVQAPMPVQSDQQATGPHLATRGKGTQSFFISKPTHQGQFAGPVSYTSRNTFSFFLSWCVQARGHTQMCLLRSHSPWFSETKSLTGLEVTKQATLTGQGKQRDPRLCLSSTGMTGACCHTQVWEITLRSLCRHG